MDEAKLSRFGKRAAKFKFCPETIRSRLEEDHGLQIDASWFYSGIPSLSEINNSFEYSSDGISLPVHAPHLFNLEEELELLKKLQADVDISTLASLASDCEFTWRNSQFAHSDALNLSFFLKRMEIKRVIEIGSGWSSRITCSILNESGSNDITCIDPEPRADLSHLPINFIKSPVQSIEPRIFTDQLEPGDLLFIDSSHTLKAGSDCLFIYSQIVPNLKPGVFVHIHDLYLPYARPIKDLIERRLFWHEDYAVLFLMLGGVIKPILSNYFLSRTPEGNGALIQPPEGCGKGGGSIYFEKC